jgi:hypothetical protein
MAELAMQRKDGQALDLGLVAFDLSNIIGVDFRDAFGAISQLAFAANQCGVEPVDRATAVIPDLSPQLLEMFKHPRPARVTRDSHGNVVFWNPWRHATEKEPGGPHSNIDF